MKKVMVFGVFDLLHPGHISFMKQAKKLGSYLIVSVARDVNVKKIKGKSPIFSEKKRVEHVQALKIANEVVLGGIKDPWPHIKKEQPDIIALGYDQQPYITNHVTRNMKQELQKHGLKTKVVRLKPFRPQVFKSSIIRRKR